MIKTSTSTETVDEMWNMIVQQRKFIWSRTIRAKSITRIIVKFSIVLEIKNAINAFQIWSIKSFDFIEGIVHFLLTKPYTLTIAVHLKLSLLFISSCNFSLSNFFFFAINWHKQTQEASRIGRKTTEGTTSRTASSYRRTKVRMG